MILTSSHRGQYNIVAGESMNLNQLDEIFNYIDLVPGEVKVYLALLQKRNCSPSEVAKIAGLKRTKVYDLLTSLEKKGACVLKQSNQKIYEPVDPALLLEKVRKRLSLVTVNISEVSDELSKIYDNPSDSNDVVDYVELISDPILILNKNNSLLELAENEILISSAGESISEQLEKKEKELARLLYIKSNRLVIKALQNNVLVHIIIGMNDSIKGLFDVYDRKLLDYENFDIHFVENIPCKLGLIDGEHIIILLKGIRTGKYKTSTIYMKDKGLGSYHRKCFYTYWEEGISIREIDIDVLENEGRIKRK